MADGSLKLSKTAPYSEIPVQGVPNWYSLGLEFIQAGYNDRIRQDGTIYQIRFAVANASALEEFNFTVWRQNGKNFDRVASTDNLVKNISNGINIINLSPPIEGIKEGDFYGYRIRSTFPENTLYVDLKDEKHLTYFTNEPESYTNYNWSAQATDNKIFVIETYMVKPYMVFIGDSIIKGNISQIPTTIEYQWRMKVNRSYQNMGIGGDRTFQINKRFDPDVVKLSPEFVLIEGGINDLSSKNISDTEILANWESMIQKAHNNKITPVIMLILPSNISGTDEKVNITASLNERLMILAAKYSPSILVDARCYVGVYRPSGPPGNCWNTNASYTVDTGLHFNRFGNERIAQAIKDSFRFIYGKKGLFNLIQQDGTVIYSTNLSDAINTSWRMASKNGTANVSYNSPSSKELANITIHSGIVDWFQINDITSDLVYYLFRSNGEQVDHNSSTNNNVLFTADLYAGTYLVLLEPTASTAIQMEEERSDYMASLFLLIEVFFVIGLIIEVFLWIKRK
ncbi:MAG: GDSL-type esterase/lipase family protein [Candidatus Methanoperedens sp.]|nr:GDSL-type esterase/lipase family protein [Candidatus Methanoperedens sp.]